MRSRYAFPRRYTQICQDCGRRFTDKTAKGHRSFFGHVLKELSATVPDDSFDPGELAADRWAETQVGL